MNGSGRIMGARKELGGRFQSGPMTYTLTPTFSCMGGDSCRELPSWEDAAAKKELGEASEGGRLFKVLYGRIREGCRRPPSPGLTASGIGGLRLLMKSCSEKHSRKGLGDSRKQ